MKYIFVTKTGDDGMKTSIPMPIDGKAEDVVVYGLQYAGSSLKRKNDIRRKHNRKYA